MVQRQDLRVVRAHRKRPTNELVSIFAESRNTHLLNQSLLIDPRGQMFEINRSLDRIAQVHNELDIDIGFNESVGNPFDHGIEGLLILAPVLGASIRTNLLFHRG